MRWALENSKNTKSQQQRHANTWASSTMRLSRREPHMLIAHSYSYLSWLSFYFGWTSVLNIAHTRAHASPAIAVATNTGRRTAAEVSQKSSNWMTAKRNAGKAEQEKERQENQKYDSPINGTKKKVKIDGRKKKIKSYKYSCVWIAPMCSRCYSIFMHCFVLDSRWRGDSKKNEYQQKKHIFR